MKMYRQGDVMIRQVAALPALAIDSTPKGRIVLAHGKVTGHAHAIGEGEAREFTWADEGKAARRFLSVMQAAVVRHEEHAAIPLSAGFYEIVQQREYSPEEIRNVAD